ncbi:hypothetical protein RIF29_23880 [Crotalaria pallida]|uniref:Glycosyltransferase n=1 Tax=Crotalaria pallida TaxID=3830 RepID=A0AAN9HXY5_CROPI
MSTTENEKGEVVVVFVPSPGMGHLVATTEFAKHLINRHPLLSVTLFHIQTPFDSAIPSSSYTHFLSSSSSERLHLITLPQPPPPPPDHNKAASFMASLLESQKSNVRDAVSNLNNIGAFVVDMFCTTMIEVARELGVPAFVFFTSGVAFLSLVLHLHTLRERDNFDATELKDAPETELIIPGFANPVPAGVLPSTVLNKEWDSFFLSVVKGLKTADGFLVNSFEELESHAIHSFPHAHHHIPMYPVGPILKLTTGDNDNDVITWLDHQPPSSVIFLCFGSMGSMDQEQAREIALALEASGARFLWSLRKPTPKGTMAPPTDYDPEELVEVLPEGFLDRTAGIGRVIGWAPQAQVLAHRATAGFVSHCGWNSTLESIHFGVPMATWPLYAEQQINAFELVRELDMAVEIALDYRVEYGAGRNTLLSAEKIERGIREVLGKDEGGRGEMVRKRVKEMSEKSRKTLAEEGGSSYSHLGRFIDHIINH